MSFLDESAFGANIKEFGLSLVDADPTLGTADTNEVNIRTKISFANLRFSFPVTDPNTLLTLPAYITSLSDSYTPNWNQQNVFGRSDPIPVYQGTTRNIQMSFAIPAYDSADANENMKKIDRLIKNLYPTYKTHGANASLGIRGNRIIDGAPLTRIRFANLINNPNKPGLGLLGYITSFSFDINPSKGFFMETGIPFVTAGGALFPRVSTFSITFSPLHEETLGWDSSKEGAWFGNAADFPYGTKRGPGDLITAVGGSLGLGEDIGFSNIFGGNFF